VSGDFDGVVGLDDPPLPAKTRRRAGELIFWTRVMLVFGVVGVVGSRFSAELLGFLPSVGGGVDGDAFGTVEVGIGQVGSAISG